MYESLLLSLRYLVFSGLNNSQPMHFHYLTGSLPTLLLPEHIRYLAFSLPVLFATRILSQNNRHVKKIYVIFYYI